MASKELSAIVELAKQIVAAAPKLDHIEGLERRIDELKKAINGFEGTHRQIQSAIVDAGDKHTQMIGETEKKRQEILVEAKQEAGSIIANAHAKADSIIQSAQQTEQQINDALASKRDELQRLIEETNDAQSKHSKITSILKGMVS